LRAGLFKAGLGAVEGVVFGIEGRLADELFGEQAGIAFALGAGGGQFAFGSRQLGAGAAGSQLQVGRVEAGQGLPSLDFGAGIDQAGGDLAANAEGQIDFVPGADFPRVDAALGGECCSRLDEHGRCRRRRCFAIAAGTEQRTGAEQQEHEAGVLGRHRRRGK